MIYWDWFPRSDPAPLVARTVVDAFTENADAIASGNHTLKSNDVLAVLRPGLQARGFTVESGKKVPEKIQVPVLFGQNGHVVKSFEAGRAIVNNQFLKDLFQACMMHDVDYLGIAVRNTYVGPDYRRMVEFFETLYTSSRMQLPLRGILTIGY